MTKSTLNIGNKYTKKELAEILKEPTLAVIREGLYHCKTDNSTLFFADLEKKNKEERFHFDDFFEGEYFHWDSQTTQHIDSPRIQQIVKGERITHLFVRVQQKIKSKTQPFVYCGRLEYQEYELDTAYPVHIIFKNIDHDDFTENEDLLEIYSWKPGKIGKSTKSKISRINKVSKERKRKYKKPNSTESRGLVTSRVGQGYYRQEIIEKWNGKCAVTDCDIIRILIASHILPWSKSNDNDRHDVENGILLAPHIDALFDRHLISFEDDGTIIISDKINDINKELLGLKLEIRIPVSHGMKKYLKLHREQLYASN